MFTNACKLFLYWAATLSRFFHEKFGLFFVCVFFVVSSQSRSFYLLGIACCIYSVFWICGYLHFNCICSHQHSSVDGVDHLIRLLFSSEPSSFVVYCFFVPSTDTYLQPWVLTVIPEDSKRMVDRRHLCFLSSIFRVPSSPSSRERMIHGRTPGSSSKSEFEY